MTASQETVDNEWLSAAETLRLVGEGMGDYTARLGIAKRARDRLVRTHAVRFIKHRETQDNVDLPAEFWWAEGHEALEQNWVTGDFSTWIDRTWEWKAYGVRFCRDDILAMIPTASPPVRQAEGDDLVSSANAHKSVTEACGDESAAAGVLLDWAKAGELAGHARTYQLTVEGGPITTERDRALQPEDWSRFDVLEPAALMTGIVTKTGWDSWERETVTTRMTGLRFSGVMLAGLLESLPTVPAQRPPTQGGRPPANWWEDLIIDIFAKIYLGDLKPERQSHVEDAMNDWLVAHGHSASGSTVRKRARKVWEAINREGEN